MFESAEARCLDQATTLVAGFVERFDPPVWTSTDAATLVTVFSRLERLAAAGKTLAARRAADGNAWQGSGHKTADDWLAAQTGTTRADAAKTLRTAKDLDACPGTEDSLRSGDLSADQAAAITSAASVDPTAEETLLGEARTGTVEALQKSARQARASATPDDQLDKQRRAHQTRFCRTWTDDDGAFNGRFRLTAGAGATLAAALDAHRNRVFTAARSEGRRERADALNADALVAMATASTSEQSDGRVDATVIVRVDHTALARGHTVAGEECTIDGIGPIPVATARRLASDSVIAALLADGDRICDVRIVGRTIPRRLRMALIARDRTCVIPGCDTTRHLEIHHLDPICRDGPTSLDNTCRACTWHHDQITYRGAGLTRTPTGWCYTPGADDPDGGPFDDGWTDRNPPS